MAGRADRYPSLGSKLQARAQPLQHKAHPSLWALGTGTAWGLALYDSSPAGPVLY